MPCPGPFHFSHSVDYIYEFCPLPNPDVGPSIFVCDVEHTSFHFGLCGNVYVHVHSVDMFVKTRAVSCYKIGSL